MHDVLDDIPQESVLNSIKKLLGLDSDYNAFDTDVVIGINAALAALGQITDGEIRMITGPDETWDILGLLTKDVYNLAKMYVYLRTRLSFDPPTNSFLVTSMEKQITEYEWRLEVLSHKIIAFPVGGQVT